MFTNSNKGCGCQIKWKQQSIVSSDAMFEKKKVVYGWHMTAVPKMGVHGFAALHNAALICD